MRALNWPIQSKLRIKRTLRVGGDRVFRGWPRVFMTSNIVEENAADPWADINGTVISVAVVCCLIAFVGRVVLF